MTGQGQGEQIATSLGVLGLQHQDEMSNLDEHFAWAIMLCLSHAMSYRLDFLKFLYVCCMEYLLF